MRERALLESKAELQKRLFESMIKPQARLLAVSCVCVPVHPGGGGCVVMDTHWMHHWRSLTVR